MKTVAHVAKTVISLSLPLPNFILVVLLLFAIAITDTYNKLIALYYKLTMIISAYHHNG